MVECNYGKMGTKLPINIPSPSLCYLLSLLRLFLCSVGAGVGPTIQIGEQTVITVDAKAAGKGKVTCTVCTPDGGEVDVDVVENEDGTFDIFYTAPQPGKYVICVRFGGEHIPNSPFQVTVHTCHTDPLFVCISISNSGQTLASNLSRGVEY